MIILKRINITLIKQLQSTCQWKNGMSLEIAGDFNRYLIQYVFVEVWHVAMIRHWSIIIILEVLLQSHGVMWNIQYCIQVVGKHLEKKRHRHGCCFQSHFLQRSACFFTHTGCQACQDSFLLLLWILLRSEGSLRYLTTRWKHNRIVEEVKKISLSIPRSIGNPRIVGIMSLIYCIFLSHGGTLDFELGAVTWLPPPSPPI